jgi:hypothetical protein
MSNLSAKMSNLIKTDTDNKGSRTLPRAQSAAPKQAPQYRENRHSDEFDAVIDADSGEPASSPAHSTLPSLEILRWAEVRMKQRFPTFKKQMGAIAKIFDAG